MDWLFPAVVASLSGTVVLTGTYLYIYLSDRKPFLLIWTAGWAVYALRFIFMLLFLGASGWAREALSMANEIAALGSGVLLLWGTCAFLGRTMPRLWLYLALFNVPWIILSKILELPFLAQTLTTYGFLGVAYGWTGIVIIRHARLGKAGRNLTGWAFVVWGIHKADYPFLRPLLWFAPWGYLLGAMLEIIVAIGMLLTYFQISREEMEKSEDRLRVILDSLDALVYAADLKSYDLLFMNKYGRDIWGADCLGKKCWQVLQSGQNGPCTFCTNERLLSADGTPAGVYVWEFQNTLNRRWYDCRDQAINWRGNGLVRLEIATDITSRKEAEQEISTAKEEWERTFANMVDVVTIQDGDHRILRANHQACRVLGVEAGELEGRFCYEVFHGGTAPCHGCPAVFSATDASTHAAEIVHERLGKVFSVSASPVYGPDGELASIVYISRDVTELKVLEGQLRQAQKMEAIGTLAGGIAHDFNNILTPVLGYSEIIAESLPAGSPLAEPAREVLLAGKRARDLVRQILSFSRQTEQECYPIEINLVVKEALKLLRSSLPATIEIRQEIEPQCGVVMADPTMIHQVVMNLCTNAYHAMRETGGVLAVTLAKTEIGPDDYIAAPPLKPGPYLRLTVGDTGCGMPRHVLERIFEPYFTTKAKGEGTGMGLSVVHGIVTALGGHVTVYSEPGNGTTFHVYLPRYVGENGLEEAAETSAPLPGGQERILVVDDEKVVAELVQKTLETLGYEVTAATDPGEALELFTAQPAAFDLVITDMTMPHLTGAELTRRLLKIRPALPVIICTGFSEIINEEKAAGLGIRQLLMKPVLRDKLARAVREELDRPV